MHPCCVADNSRLHRCKDNLTSIISAPYTNTSIKMCGLGPGVEITKGSSTFHYQALVTQGFKTTYEWLTSNTSLLTDKSISDAEFVHDAADLLEKVNYLHPFRDGNGRTQRAYLDQIASISGRVLSWRNVGKIENERASIRAFNAGSGEPFRNLLEVALEPPLEGLSLLDQQLYVAAPSIETNPPRRTV